MSGGTFNFSELTLFRKNFEKACNQFDAWLTKFLLDEGMRFIAGVKPRTPVDTGDLRNHWTLEGVTREGDTLHCWFVNSMDYATHVEYGHAKPYKSGAAEGSSDWVQGYFMMTVTLDEIYRAMPARFRTAFAQFLRSMEVL